MKFKSVYLVVFSLFLLFGLFSTKVAFADTFQLTGIISDSNGNAISGTTIDIYNPGTTTDVVPSVISDNSGSYTVSIPSGTYDIKVNPPAGSLFTSSLAPSHSIIGNSTINFVLVSGGIVSLTGHIYSNLGVPLHGQPITLQSGNSGPTTNSQTDNSGSYSFLVSPASNYHISCGNCGGGNNYVALSAPQIFSFDIFNFNLSNSIVQDFTVPANHVVVHVQDSSGNPVSYVSINASNSNGNAATNVSLANGVSGSYQTSASFVTTDTSGNVDLWLYPNTYRFYVQPQNGSGYPITILPNVTISGDMTETITLQTPVTLSGHIYNSLGAAIPNQTISLQLGNSGPTSTSTTDNSGAYSFSVLSGQNYHISCSNCGGGSNYIAINTPQVLVFDIFNFSLNQNTTLDLMLPASRVLIHVQDSSGNPVSHVSINATNSNGSPAGNVTLANGITGSYQTSLSQVTTDTSGDVVAWLYPNTYRFYLQPPSGSNLPVTILPSESITGDMTETITLQQPVTLSGHIYSSLGIAIPNQTITLQAGNSGPTTNATTDSNGVYSATVLSAPNYHISCANCGAGNSYLALNAPQNDTFDILNFVLNQNTSLDVTLPSNKVVFHVQDSLGNPLSNIAISSANQSGSPASNVNFGGTVSGSYQTTSYQITTDASGNVTAWLYPNNYRVVVQPPTGGIYSQMILNNLSVTGDQTSVISLQYNHAAPVTTATFTPVADAQGNYANPTTVSFLATAASGYTIANTYYTLDGGTQQTYASPLSVSGLGSHTLTYWSVDNSGAIEGTNTKTFTIAVSPSPTPTPIPHTLSKINFAKPWIGLVSTSDAGLKIDLKAEVYDNTTLVTTGTANSVVTGGVGLSNAKLDVVSFPTFSPVSVPQGSQMTLKLYARNACSGSTKDTGTVRLYYNDSQASSRMSALIDGASHDYFLLTPSLLSRTVGVGPQQTTDISLGAKCSTFTSIGTWGITL